MSEIAVNSKTSLSTTAENMLTKVKTYSSDIESAASALSGITNCDDIDLSSAANTIISNFDALFKDYTNVAETFNNYITNLIQIDVDDFAAQNVSATENGTNTFGETGHPGTNGTVTGTPAGPSTDSSTSSTTYPSTGQTIDESIIETAEGKEIILPSGLGSVRTYMGWQCITNTSSQQYKLMQTAGVNFDEEGFGIIGDRYVVATTNTYGNVGDYIDVYQEDGSVLKCIIGDIKNQNDAGCNKWGHLNGTCVLESVVDKNTWYRNGAGNHSNPGTSSCHPEWDQDIVKIVNKGNYFDYISQ